MVLTFTTLQTFIKLLDVVQGVLMRMYCRFADLNSTLKVLEAGDIVLKVQGSEIGDDGKVPFRGTGLMSFRFFSHVGTSGHFMKILDISLDQCIATFRILVAQQKGTESLTAWSFQARGTSESIFTT